jgi:amino acid transporter
MVSASIPAGAATLLLLQSDYAQSQTAVTLCSVAWLSLITFLVIRGIGLTAKFQIIMTLMELMILLGISLLVIFQLSHIPSHQLTWAHFSPFSFTPTSFANGAVIALFFFWGWDVSINLTEETKNSEKSPGYGVIGAIIIIIVAFTAFAAVCLLALSDDEISNSGTNIIFAVADKVLPKPWNYVAVLALILSTIGTIETSMLQFSRTMFSKSRAGIFHTRWAQVHLKWKTPFAATLLIASIGVTLLLLSLSSESINEVMMASINIIGVQAAYYYGLAGFACAWHFRKKALSSAKLFLTMLIWPVLSAIALWWAAVLSIQGFDQTTTVIAIGSLCLGFIPLYKRKQALQSSSKNRQY